MSAQAGVRVPAGSRRLPHSAALILTVLGVVYGDIGTSPLYALRECFSGSHGVPPTPANVLGVLSLVFWALVLVISVKYISVVMRADNNGEGGILALMALVYPERKGGEVRWALVALGLFGAALLYGDGMITPAISVLSAVEGLQVATPVFQPYVVPLTVGILVTLFLFQSRGTAAVGAVFGPITLTWFVAIGLVGLGGIVRAPVVLEAISPWYAVRFFAENGLTGFLVLGAVFLVVTGGEALYADMGHFGPGPIRLAWFTVVLPALLINYFGQGALLLVQPGAVENPFYRLVPGWAHYPMVALATAATVIASQAIISGAFSLTRQAVQLGYCPRVHIRHTSAREVGQIYVPLVNWVLMGATIGLVFGFRSSSQLAAAYGVAVATTMVITTVLAYVVAHERWRWPMWAAALGVGTLLVIDLAFLGANVLKITHGGWFPLVVAAAIYVLMSTWKQGRRILADRLRASSMPVDQFLDQIAEQPPLRVPGTAVFLTGSPVGVPPALVHNVKYNRVLHEQVILLTIATSDVPRVPKRQRLEVSDLGNGLYRIVAHYGFMEDPNVIDILRLAAEHDVCVDPDEATFFLGRELLVATRRPGMALWRERLFIFMSQNARRATDFFRIPTDRIVELAVRVEL